MSVAFQFVEAEREACPLLIGIAGPTGSGKTMSALRLGNGLVTDPVRELFFIDTERGRGKHYARRKGQTDGYPFRYLALEPPFSPDRYLGAIKAAEAAGAKCIVVDSMSHEWEGEGGLREQAEDIAAKMAAKWNKSPDIYTFPSWREPKQAHQRFVNALLQLTCHVILCFRAKEKRKIVKGQRGQEIVSDGIRPITEEGLPYEATLFAMLESERPGVATFPYKALARQFHGMFNEEKLSEKHGKALAAWAGGGDAGDLQEVAKRGQGSSEPAPEAGNPRSASAAEPSAPSTGPADEHDPDTGEVTDSFWTGRKLTVTGGDSAAEWADMMVARIQQAPSPELLSRVWTHNEPTIIKLQAEDGPAYDRLVEANEAREASFQQPELIP